MENFVLRMISCPLSRAKSVIDTIAIKFDFFFNVLFFLVKDKFCSRIILLYAATVVENVPLSFDTLQEMLCR